MKHLPVPAEVLRFSDYGDDITRMWLSLSYYESHRQVLLSDAMPDISYEQVYIRVKQTEINHAFGELREAIQRASKAIDEVTWRAWMKANKE